MITVADNSAVAVDCKPSFRLKAQDSLLSSQEGCTGVLNDLLETPPLEFGRKDFALLNLLCAPSLPGSENLDIPKCLTRLDRLTDFVKAKIDRNRHRFPTDPDYSHCKPMWLMAHLITIVKRDFGATYNPRIRDNYLANIHEPITDSRDAFIHGLLDDDPKRRWGTCASIPVLVTAVARRLGYPVGLAVAGRHVYARWEGDDVCFNIEASNPMGMTIPSDEGLHEKIKRTKMLPKEEESGYYRRTLFPAEEFALFLSIRIELLVCVARYEETLLWSARALQFAPDEPRFPYLAHNSLDLAMKHRLRRIHPNHRIPSSHDSKSFLNVGDLLRPEERSLFLTIVAHYKEARGELVEARQLYGDACRHNSHGNNEQRDLQRFLRKHDHPRRIGPLIDIRQPSERSNQNVI
jgi:hypothetical protein